MKLKVLPLVGFLITISVFSFTQANNQNLTYVEGYQAGKKAAKVDIKNDPNPFLDSTKYLTLPDHRVEQIKNKPSPYQRGFKEGYKEGAKRALTTSPKWWMGLIGGIAAFSLVFALVVTVGS